MAVTLDPILQAAQDGANHRPIIKVVSTQFEQDRPFDGSYFNSSDVSEQHPDLIAMASGRMAGIYVRSGRYLNLKITDAERTEWSDIQVYGAGAGTAILHVSLVEIDGDIGLVWIEDAGSTRYLRQMVVRTDGTVASPMSTIASVIESSAVISDCRVRRIQGSYWLVYVKYTVSETMYSIQKRTSTDFSGWSSESEIIG